MSGLNHSLRGCYALVSVPLHAKILIFPCIMPNCQSKNRTNNRMIFFSPKSSMGLSTLIRKPKAPVRPVVSSLALAALQKGGWWLGACILCVCINNCLLIHAITGRGDQSWFFTLRCRHQGGLTNRVRESQCWYWHLALVSAMLGKCRGGEHRQL